MNIYFDFDYTLIAMDGTLRPHTKETFSRLIDDGHKIYIWSGVGDRSTDIDRLKLSKYVSDVFVKPLTDFEVGLTRFEVDPIPDFVVDDHREIVEHFGGIHIEPFYFRSSNDERMKSLYEAVFEFSECGKSAHRGFKKKPEKGLDF